MSVSSMHSSSGDDSHSSSGDDSHSSSGDDSSSTSHSNALLVHRNNIKEHEVALSKAILLQSECTLPHLEDNLPHSAGTLPPYEDTPSQHTDILSQPKNHTMSNANRSRYRDVHIFDASERNTAIGGLILTNGVTNANFYAMVEIIIILESEFTLRNESDVVLEKDSSPLLPGNYYVYASKPYGISDEPVSTRACSIQTGTRIQGFCDAVRLRDRRCVVTGEKYLDDDNWVGLEAAHIFPLAYESQWVASNYSRWISILPDKGGSINSVQNGLLLETGVHQSFDMYNFSINPDDDYKIVCFTRDRKGIAGRHLDRSLLDDPQRPVEQLLRWHFRQAVLSNMRGAGEPRFEHDFPPGSDIVGTILEGPKAAARMEFELFNRLGTQFDLTRVDV